MRPIIKVNGGRICDGNSFTDGPSSFSWYFLFFRQIECLLEVRAKFVLWKGRERERERQIERDRQRETDREIEGKEEAIRRDIKRGREIKRLIRVR